MSIFRQPHALADKKEELYTALTCCTVNWAVRIGAVVDFAAVKRDIFTVNEFKEINLINELKFSKWNSIQVDILS